jgi:hypothetical protein
VSSFLVISGQLGEIWPLAPRPDGLRRLNIVDFITNVLNDLISIKIEKC